jgi:hypothetical protein
MKFLFQVEEYIMVYLGESKNSKEFKEEFLLKRIELRPRKVQKEDVNQKLDCYF